MLSFSWRTWLVLIVIALLSWGALILLMVTITKDFAIATTTVVILVAVIMGWSPARRR